VRHVLIAGLFVAGCSKPAPPVVVTPPLPPPAAVKPAPLSAAKLAQKAEAALVAGEVPADLEKELTEAITRKADADLLAARGSLRERMGRGDEALADYAQAIQLAADRLELRRRRMALLEKHQRWNELSLDLDYFVAADEKDLALRLKRARARVHIQDFAHAIEDFTVLIDASPEDDPLRMERARCASEVGQRELAVGDVTHVLLKAPSAELYATLGGYEWRERRFEETRQYYEKGLKLDAKNFSCLCGMAEILPRREPKVAFELADLAVTVNPKSARALFLRGQARLFLLDRNAAADDLLKAMDMDPSLKDQGMVLLDTPVEQLLKDRQKDFGPDAKKDHDHKDPKDPKDPKDDKDHR